MRKILFCLAAVMTMTFTSCGLLPDFDDETEYEEYQDIAGYWTNVFDNGDEAYMRLTYNLGDTGALLIMQEWINEGELQFTDKWEGHYDIEGDPYDGANMSIYAECTTEENDEMQGTIKVKLSRDREKLTLYYPGNTIVLNSGQTKYPGER